MQIHSNLIDLFYDRRLLRAFRLDSAEIKDYAGSDDCGSRTNNIFSLAILKPKFKSCI